MVSVIDRGNSKAWCYLQIVCFSVSAALGEKRNSIANPVVGDLLHPVSSSSANCNSSSSSSSSQSRTPRHSLTSNDGEQESRQLQPSSLWVWQNSVYCQMLSFLVTDFTGKHCNIASWLFQVNVIKNSQNKIEKRKNKDAGLRKFKYTVLLYYFRAGYSLRNY